MAVLGGLAESIYSPALVNIATFFSIDASTAQLSYSVYLAAFALSQVPYGLLSDRHGRRKTYLYGLLFFILGTTICYSSNNFSLFLFGRMFQGFGSSLGAVIVRAMIMDHTDYHEQKRISAYLISALSLSPLLGPIIGSVIAHVFTWQACFVFIIMLAFVIWGVAFFKLFETNQHMRPATISLCDHLQILKTPQFLKYTIIGGLTVSGTFIYISASPFIFANYESYSVLKVGFFFFINSAGYIIGSAGSARLMANTKSPHVILKGLIVMLFGSCCILSLIYFTSINSPWVIAMPMMIFSGGIGLIKSRTAILALKPFAKNKGLSSAYLGTLQILICSAIIDSVRKLSGMNAHEMAWALFSLAVGTLLIHILWRL